MVAAEEDPAEMGHGAEGGGVFCVSLYFLMMIELCIAIYLLLHIGEGFVGCINCVAIENFVWTVAPGITKLKG